MVKTCGERPCPGTAPGRDPHQEDTEPEGDRRARWQRLLATLPVPLVVRSAPSRSFPVEAVHAEFGAVQILSVAAASCEVRRPADRGDPPGREFLVLKAVLHGRHTFVRDRYESRLRPLELAVYDVSRPFRATSYAECGALRHLTVLFPRDLLPLSRRQVERVTGTPLPGGGGIGALLMGMLNRLVADAGRDEYGPREAARLGNVVLDLLASLLSHQLEAPAALPREAVEPTLMARIRAYVDEHLDDPELTPAAIAAAHHVSTRTLHRLFHDQEWTVSGWIRQRRLERCRQDLADPRLGEEPIHSIAAHWGFFNPAHFSRVFRGAFGASPQEFRARRRDAGHAGADDRPPARRWGEGWEGRS
ncbi:hypothetical protein GCM10027168_52010 [Streptomyces capparidis]